MNRTLVQTLAKWNQINPCFIDRVWVSNLKARCTVIVLNYNGEKLLPACLDSLARQNGGPIDTVIVDNASTDGSAALVAQHYPSVRFLALDKNYGFTGANNAALRDAPWPGAANSLCYSTMTPLRLLILYPNCSL